ncbi:MAG: ABC transporter ATP-binding protein [Ktedonobacteraceae bacterium]
MQVTKVQQKASPYFDLSQFKENVRIYMRVIALLRPHLVESVATVICIALATLFTLIVPWLLQWVIDVGIRTGNLSELLLVAAAILGTSILRGLFAYGQGYFSQSISNLVAYDLRSIMYDHLQNLSFSFHDDSETGQLMSRMTADIEAVRMFFPMGLLRAIVAIVTFGSITIILFRLDVSLALVTLISVPILLYLAFEVTKRLRPLWLQAQNGMGDLSTVMQESLAGVRVVKSFAREEFEIDKFGSKNMEVRELNMGAMRLSAWNQPLMVFALNAITVLVLWIGGIAVINRSLSLGTLAAVVQYVLLLATPVRTFGFMINWFVRGLSGGTRIFSILDTRSDIKDVPDAKVLPRIEGHVSFEHVSFAYNNGIEVLYDIDIDAQPGQVTAILGPTGSGKSSILHLLPRFYDVKEGRVLVDGNDVRDVTQASLRRQIGLVLQDVFLFNATIRENIAYGVMGATDEQVVEAAKSARIHDFILTLPNGYNTWVGERGVTLSGGQKQRVAIARTLLLNPAILVLDDSTSSVDMETEYLIQQALEAVMRGRTTFVVASRLRTIKNADQIIVLDRGRIVERGNHASLLKLNGPYSRLYDLQLREQEEFEARMLDTSGPFDEPEGSDTSYANGQSEVLR